MAIIDTILYTKTAEGQAVRVGDVGKSVIRTLPESPTIDDLEEHYFYTTPVSTDQAGFIGEINNIQVEPALNKDPEAMEAGDAIIYGTGDLL